MAAVVAREAGWCCCFSVLVFVGGEESVHDIVAAKEAEHNSIALGLVERLHGIHGEGWQR